MAGSHEARGPGSEQETYIHGYSDAHRAFLAARTAANDARFLLPHLRQGMRLLDCGCGQGSITVDFAEIIAPGEVIGIDLEPKQIEAAGALAIERNVTNVHFEAGNVYALPFSDASFDVVFANTVLEHLSDPLSALKEMRRILKPGGIIGVRDPNYTTMIFEPATPLLQEAMALLHRVFQRNGGQLSYARHLRQLLLEAGCLRTEGSASVTYAGNQQTTSSLFTVLLNPQFQDASFVKTAIGEGWADHAQLQAMLAEMQAWAKRSDAFFALMMCEAVGWVAGD